MADKGCYDRGDTVEVQLTDDSNEWVEAVVISDMEHKVFVRLKDPVIMVEKTKIIIKRWFGLMTTVNEEETWRNVGEITFAKHLIRNKKATN